MILYELLRVGYAQRDNGLDVSTIALLPAFLYTAAVAWRLAKFNISTNQTDSFIGVPSPATGLLIASFPLIVWHQYFEIQTFFINPWILYALVAIISYLLVCNRRFMALKFKDLSFKTNGIKYALLIIGVISIFLLKWLAVPMIFIMYLVLSIFSKEEISKDQTETKDITV
jgi:CDP-diacylglycerol--serine O-phosphatidyltransferase